MPGSILGNLVRRLEDPELLVGAGQYVDDMPQPGVLYAEFVRSPYPHAAIRSVDTTVAAAMPGVVAVYDGWTLGLDVQPPPFGEYMHPAVHRSPLARDRARYASEAVAIVIAETRAQAFDATEAVEIDWEILEAVTDLEAAVAPGAPRQFEGMESNIGTGLQEPDPDPLEGAEVIIRGRFENQRVAVAPMEGNTMTAIPGGPGDEYRLTAIVGTQVPHRTKANICKFFGYAPEDVRVIVPNVGGAFGGKFGVSPEHVAVIAAARNLNRPVRWFEGRSDNLTTMHGRGQVQFGELGLTRDGMIVGLRARMLGDAGAYAGFGGGLVLGQTRNMAQGCYEIPKIRFDAAVVLTNTCPVGAFRGAGRPEAAAFLERLMDMAADELGIDPVELRRKNFIGRDKFPYRTRTGMLYDVGDYEKSLDEVLRIADYPALLAEQAERRDRGDRVQLGIGISTYVEITAGGQDGEFGSVEVHTDGSATIKVGTAASGQGHATAFSMIVSEHLGIPIDQIHFVQADTKVIPRGGGTGGSRSLQIGGAAVNEAARSVLEIGRSLAAELLEADLADITVGDDGRVGVQGVPATALGWGELAGVAASRGEVLAADHDFTPPGPTYPFGAHISVVEVDTETGFVTPIRHIAVDDAGTVINPLLVKGQQHGGIAQGISQALWEEFRYDDDGNPITGNFSSYCIPSAAEVCSYEASSTETPTPYNPLGAKGIGESSTIGSTPAVQNAVVDALSHLGIRHIDMPCSPERVWRAIQDAKSGTLPEPWREPPDVFDTLAIRPAPVVGDDNQETI